MTSSISRHNPDVGEIDAFYLLACMILWRKTGDVKARRELIRALASPDPRARCLSARLLSNQSPTLMPVLCTVA